jgi:anthranilate synthase component II
MKIVIIDNYDSFTFNLYQMLQPLTDERIQVFRNDAIDFDQLKLLRPDKIVLSPGPGHPSIASDFGIGAAIINRQEELNAHILGVCLGHQGIVHHFGGEVVRAPYVVHGKASQIDILHETKILDGLPRRFEAMRYHSLVAAEEGFPSVLQITARESEHGLIMALEHKTKPIYGVQFHPESIGTPEGSRLLRNFVEVC